MLEHGADPLIKNKNGITSYELLLESNYEMSENFLNEAVDYFEQSDCLKNYLFSVCEKSDLKLLENVLKCAKSKQGI